MFVYLVCMYICFMQTESIHCKTIIERELWRIQLPNHVYLLFPVPSSACPLMLRNFPLWETLIYVKK